MKSLLDFASDEHVTPMSTELSKLLVVITINELQELKQELKPINFEAPEGAFPETFKENWLFKVACRRMAVLSPETRVSTNAFCFVVLLCDSPAKAVMWCFALHRLYLMKNAVTLKTLVDAFPHGFPTDAVCKEA